MARDLLTGHHFPSSWIFVSPLPAQNYSWKGSIPAIIFSWKALLLLAIIIFYWYGRAKIFYFRRSNGREDDGWLKGSLVMAPVYLYLLHPLLSCNVATFAQLYQCLTFQEFFCQDPQCTCTLVFKIFS